MLYILYIYYILCIYIFLQRKQSAQKTSTLEPWYYGIRFQRMRYGAVGSRVRGILIESLRGQQVCSPAVINHISRRQNK